MTDEQFANLIESKTTRRIEFDAAQVPLFERPVVYMALSSHGCLYVGMSKHGMCRAFSRDHHVLKHIWEDVTKLEVYETASEYDARCLERDMIQEFKPAYNDRMCIRSLKRRSTRSGVTDVIAHCNA